MHIHKKNKKNKGLAREAELSIELRDCMTRKGGSRIFVEEVVEESHYEKLEFRLEP